MRLPIQIVAFLFRKGNGKTQYLIAKRIPETGGYWQPISGGLEEGETKIEALKREIREETGIRNVGRIIEDVDYFEFSNVQMSTHLIKAYVYGVEIFPNEKIVIGEEHCEFKWCSFHEALRLMKCMHIDCKEALRKLNLILA